MVLKKLTLTGKVMHVIAKEITQLKNAGFIEDAVRKMVYNKCYIKSHLDIVQGFCAVDGDEEKISRIAKRVDQEIKNQFYSKFNSKEYYAPDIKKIYVDTPYDSRKIGNVTETEFDDYSKVAGKDFKTDYSTGGKPCNIHQEITKDGKLIQSCKIEPNKED